VDYKLFQSSYIATNQQAFIDQCEQIKLLFNGEDTTANYYKYNLFAATAGSTHFYNLFKELRDIIRKEIPDKPLWFQAWVNLHTENNVLDWHNHAWDYHGYISIDPKDTATEFKDYIITNKVGQIYFGPGGRLHRVNVVTPYVGDRITIGYDITTEPIMDTGCAGLFPLL
jgi:hypothetical protein